MKLSKFAIAGAACCLFFTSCQSTKTASSKSSDSVRIDEYSSGDEAGDDVIAEYTESGKKEIKAEKKNPKKPFSWAAMFDSKFLEVDTCSVFTETAFGSLKEQSAHTVISGKTRQFGLSSPYMASNYVFLIDENGRTKIEKAMNQYMKDFSDKKLSTAGGKNKTKKIYGKIPCRLEFGTLKGNYPNYGNGYGYLGYKFVGKSPYFTISIPKVTNEAFLDNRSEVEESLEINYYFTKSQIKTFIDLLNDERLSEAVREHEVELYGEAYVNEKYGETSVTEEYGDDYTEDNSELYEITED